MKIKSIVYTTFISSLLLPGLNTFAKDRQKVNFSTEENVEQISLQSQDEDVIYFKSTFADSRLNGEWNIDNVNGEKAIGESRPTITFDLAQLRVYGNNGCNVINGDIVADKDNRLKLTNLISTQRYCPDAPLEHLINISLDQVHSYKISRYGYEYYLDLFNERGHLIMVLRKHNMDFLNGVWRVTAINEQPNANDKILFVFDLLENKIHGNAGCNIINGEIYLNPDEARSVQFSNIISTRMSCPDIATETSVLVALEETEKAYGKSDDTVIFVNSAGDPVLQLIRVDPATLQD